jgi:transposase
MIVVGVDPHKRSHTAAAIELPSGGLRGECTVATNASGHQQLLAWARATADERLWALEDCRHVSGSLEHFLLAGGERVVRVPPKLMAGARRGARRRGKSDAIDALAVARVALREPALPSARPETATRELKLLVDHRDALVGERTRLQCRLRWLLHELELGSRCRRGRSSAGSGWSGSRAACAAWSQACRRDWPARSCAGAGR